jgi:signal transduction histidine kinase
MADRVQICVILVAVLALCLVTATTRAQSPVLLDGEEVVLGHDMVFALDEGESLAEQAARFRAGRFSSTLAEAMAEWRDYQPVWAAVELTNPLPADGRAGDPWHVTSQVYGLIALDAYLLRTDGRTESLLAHDLRRAFHAADFSGLRLRTDEFLIAPGETAVLMLRVTFGPVHDASFRAETPERLEERTFHSGIGHTSFYAFALSSLIFFAGFAVAMRSGISLAYAGLLLVGLTFVAYLDLLFFRFLYPDYPGVHLPVGIGLLCLLAGAGLLIASAITPMARRTLRVAGLAVLALGVVQPVLPSEPIVLLVYGLCVAMLMANLIAVFSAGRLASGGPDRAGRWLFLALLAAVAGLLTLFLAGRLGGSLDPAVLIKGIYGIVGAWVIVANALALVDLRNAHGQAQSREIAALRSEAEAQRRYQKARDLAARRQRRLAAASHDLQQPLASLRMTMDTLAQDGEPRLRDRLIGAFDYIEGLAHGYLEEGRPTRADSEEPAEARPEPLPLSLVIGAAERMFADEAQAKGLVLRKRDSGLSVIAPAMPVMRIATNLVSNAIKHSPRGKVLLGARRQAGHALLVVADQGPGMTDAELAAYRQEWRKGAGSDGSGLGLPICFEIAAAQGWALTVTSRPGCGTCFALALPLDAGGIPVDASS